MVIDRLDMPVEPPYAAGSTRSGSLMTSSDPTIVGVDSAGNLIAHRNGEVLIRTNGGAALKAVVQTAKRLEAVPSRVELQPGQKQNLEVIADGRPLSPDAVTVSIGSVQRLKISDLYAATAKWITSEPAVLQHPG
jgi:hypothetical protein